MTKLAIVDIDNVIANPEKRFARAEEAKQALLTNQQARIDALFSGDINKEATNVYWRAVFDPAYVHLDTLISGAKEAVSRLEVEYDDLSAIYLTSRPESMRDATLAWLEAHDLRGPKLVMKSPAFQYVKTITWKAGMVQTLIELYGVRPDETIYVDDEVAHHDEVRRYLPAVKCYPSLAAVFEPEKPAMEEVDPFMPDFPD